MKGELRDLEVLAQLIIAIQNQGDLHEAKKHLVEVFTKLSKSVTAE